MSRLHQGKHIYFIDKMGVVKNIFVELFVPWEVVPLVLCVPNTKGVNKVTLTH
jgi:hypothetical protein